MYEILKPAQKALTLSWRTLNSSFCGVGLQTPRIVSRNSQPILMRHTAFDSPHYKLPLTPFKEIQQGAEEGKTSGFLQIACNVLHPMFTNRLWPDKLHSTQNLFAFGLFMGPCSMYSKNLRAYSSREMPNLLHKRDPGADSVSLFQKLHHPNRNEK